MHSFIVSTSSRSELVDITHQVQRLVADSGIRDGLCQVWVPHTTAGLTVNENADPDVTRDLLMGLDTIAPWNAGYAHGEGNSAAHIKSSLMGCEKTLIIEGGKLALGTWQGLYLCEFDGPRKRQVWVKVVAC
ncbi:MAG TPA: secondary thiamine-phosphate synthase enzyme YjbQ [Candidatus Edwardsbacteria bacterium]|nr:secondary thiamine-phosphate synthase enzyme YjbQ [Candidatus Edwardsbacteria bacterium]